MELPANPPAAAAAAAAAASPVAIAAVNGPPPPRRPLFGLTVAQFFGSFNDNAWKMFLIFLAFRGIAQGIDGDALFDAKNWETMVAIAIFMTPLTFFSLPAVTIADRIDKRRILVAMKALEVLLMAAAGITLYLFPAGGWAPLTVLAFMGFQSAFFSPAKYGILPEILPHEKLTAGNGLIEMYSFIGIILGTVCGPILLQLVGDRTWLAGIMLTVTALVGYGASLSIPAGHKPAARGAAAPPAEGGILAAWQAIRGERVIWLAVLGMVFYWVIASLLGQVVLVFANNMTQGLPLMESISGVPMGVFAIGVGFGGVLAGKLSGDKVETGLVPMGAIGMALCTLLLGGIAGLVAEPLRTAASVAPAVVHAPAATTADTLSPAGAPSAAVPPIQLPTTQFFTWMAGWSGNAVAVTVEGLPFTFYLTLVLMVFFGLASGLLLIPLNALLQWRAPENRRGGIIALSNALTFGGILAGSLLSWYMARERISVQNIFLLVTVVTVVCTIWAVSLLPEALVRFVLVVITHTLYRLKVVHRDNLPKTGGVLLTPNHVTFLDGFFILASTDRPVRFLVEDSYFHNPFLRPLAKALGAIPISGAGGPLKLLKALKAAGQYLDDGEVVCIFPEGQLTRTGMLLSFRRGMERIIKGRNAVIVPVHLDRVWGSIFSREGGRFITKWPKRLRYPVTVTFGESLPSTTPIGEVRRHVAELNEVAWAERKADRVPLHHSFIREVQRHPYAFSAGDLSRPKVSRVGALAGAIALARQLRRDWADQPQVGILLPPSVGGALVNIAAALAGKTSVNLNYTAGQAGMGSAARQAALQTVVTSRQFVEKAKLELPDGVRPIFLEDVRPKIGVCRRLLALFMARFGSPWEIEKICGCAKTPGMDDVATIIFSSGSTGEPKGVMLTHYNVDANVEGLRQVFRLTEDDRLMGILPHFHSFGYMALWFSNNIGMGTVYHPNPLDAAIIGELVQRYGITILIATPTFLQMYMRRCSPANFGSLRLVLAGAEKMPERLATAFEEYFGVRPLEGYGTTECAPTVTVNTTDFRAAGFYQPGSKRGFVGHPLPGVAVRIVDPETFAPLPNGTQGMLIVKGPNVMKGYLGRDDLTAKVMREGWYITGDIAIMDEDGFIKITDRLSRFSKIGGEMVPHGRIEEALQEASGAREQSFAVTAIPDEKKGEKIAVLTLLDPAKLPDIVAKLAAGGLPPLFIPKTHQFVKVDKLPMLGTGKLDLREIKRVAQEKLGAAKADSAG